MSGERVGAPEFVPLERPEDVSKQVWDRAQKASTKMAERFGDFGELARSTTTGLLPSRARSRNTSGPGLPSYALGIRGWPLPTPSKCSPSRATSSV